MEKASLSLGIDLLRLTTTSREGESDVIDDSQIKNKISHGRTVHYANAIVKVYCLLYVLLLYYSQKTLASKSRADFTYLHQIKKFANVKTYLETERAIFNCSKESKKHFLFFFFVSLARHDWFCLALGGQKHSHLHGIIVGST